MTDDAPDESIFRQLVDSGKYTCFRYHKFTHIIILQTIFSITYFIPNIPAHLNDIDDFNVSIRNITGDSECFLKYFPVIAVLNKKQKPRYVVADEKSACPPYKKKKPRKRCERKEKIEDKVDVTPPVDKEPPIKKKPAYPEKISYCYIKMQV